MVRHHFLVYGLFLSVQSRVEGLADLDFVLLVRAERGEQQERELLQFLRAADEVDEGIGREVRGGEELGGDLRVELEAFPSGLSSAASFSTAAEASEVEAEVLSAVSP